MPNSGINYYSHIIWKNVYLKKIDVFCLCKFSRVANAYAFATLHDVADDAHHADQGDGGVLPGEFTLWLEDVVAAGHYSKAGNQQRVALERRGDLQPVPEVFAGCH